jgi:hypothetical protein
MFEKAVPALRRRSGQRIAPDLSQHPVKYLALADKRISLGGVASQTRVMH